MISRGSDNTSDVNLTVRHAGRRCGRTTVERQCEECGRIFRPLLARVRFGRGRFCTRRCASIVAGRKSAASQGGFKGERNPRFVGWRSRNHRYYVNRCRAKHPEKAAAHDAIERAIAKRQIAKPNVCERCGFVAEHRRQIHGHHEDYSRPLDVTWVCRPCHRVLDLERFQREHPEWVAGAGRMAS